MSYQGSRKQRLLTAAEEVSLAKQIEAARATDCSGAVAEQGKRARRRLIESNLGLAISMARKYPAPDHVDREDMVQDAMLGLERAVERFDWQMGYRFSTYAAWWVRQAVQSGLENTAASVRIPAQRRQELNAALRAAGGAIGELTPRLGATFAVASMTSLDKPLGEAGAGMAEYVPIDTADPVDQVISAHESRVANQLVASLDEESRYIVARRFGLGGQDAATFTEIGAELGVTPEAVRRRVIRALKRLQPAAEAMAA